MSLPDPVVTDWPGVQRNFEHLDNGNSGGGEGVGDFTPPLVFPEQSNPATPAADTGQLYFRDNGSGKTQAVIQFPSGNRVVVATDF